MSGIADWPHHGVRHLEHRLSHGVGLRLLVDLLLRLYLNATVNKLFVASLDLSALDVFLEHLDLFLKEEILCLNLPQLLLFLFESLDVELQVLNVVFEAPDLIL